MALLTHDDDSLLDELRHVFRTADPMPPALPNAARALFEWRSTAADLAELARDREVEGGSGVDPAQGP